MLTSTMLTVVAHCIIYPVAIFSARCTRLKDVILHSVVMLPPGNREGGENGWGGHLVGG